MSNAIAYTRVSSIEQVKDGNSLVTQKRLLTEYAGRNDMHLIKLFEERGESAKTADRTQLLAMIDYCIKHKGEIDFLLVYKVDRLARNTKDYLNIREVLNKQGIQICSITEHFDNTPMGRAMENIAAVFAQLDNDNRTERCGNGLMEAARDGRWVWPAPIGYVNGRDIFGKKNVVLDPRKDYVEILRSSWELMDIGESETAALKHINQLLQEKNYKTIPKNTFSRMLRNKLYIGMIESKKHGFCIQSPTIEPLLKDADLFWRVQAIINGDKNCGNKYTKVNSKYPLRGILFCKNGHKMTASSPKGRTKCYPKYHCPKCRGLHMNYDVEEVDSKFIDYVKNIQIDERIKEALKVAIISNLDETMKNGKKEINKLKQRLVEISADKSIIVEKNIRRIIPDKTAQETLMNYETEEARIKLRISEIDTSTYDAEDLLEFGIEKLSNLAQTFTEIKDSNVRSRFQKWLFPAGLIYDGEKFGTTRLPHILRIKRTALAGVSDSFVPFGKVRHPITDESHFTQFLSLPLNLLSREICFILLVLLAIFPYVRLILKIVMPKSPKTMYNKNMNMNDRRVRENHEKIRYAVCEIISSTHPENISIKSVAARAHLSYSTVHKHITSIPNALRIFDEEILTEFQIRRTIQKSDPQIDDMAIGDFFMRLPRRSATIENI